MNEYALGYQEVIPDQTLPVIWKDIDLNTGGTQSTLQDIKIPEKANGFCYKDTSKYLTRNRFIYWRLHNDILELVEESLDVNLASNRLRYKFRDTPILDGITIHETHSNVIILVPTVSSVHRLTFPHPNRFRQDELSTHPHPNLSVPSIFADVPIMQNTNSSSFYVYVPPTTASSQLPHAAASWLTHEEEAIFLFAYPSGELLLVKQHLDGQAESIELQTDTIVSKFLSGVFRNKNNENVIVSMLLHTIGIETYAITLCRDGQIKVWSCSKPQCIAISDVLLAELGTSHETALKNTQCQLLKKVVGAEENEFMFAVYVNMDINKYFSILKPVFVRNQFTIVKVNQLSSIEGDLIDYSLTTTRIWSIWGSIECGWKLYSGQYNSEEGNDDFAWTPVVLEPLPNAEELACDGSIDPRQLYLDYIFYPGRFPLQIISKALSIYKRSLMIPDISLSVAVLKQRVSAAVESEIQEKLQETEVTDEYYLDEAMCSWTRFYSCCVQYHLTALKPLGILLLPSISGAVLLKKASYSFLRPMDILEHLVQCPEVNRRITLQGNTQISSSNEEIQDLIKFAEIFDLIEDNLNDYHKDTFENNMSLSIPPMEAVEEIIQDIITEEFFHWFSLKVKNVSDLYITIHKLLELLRMDESTPDVTLSKSLRSSVMHLFSSNLGTSIISQSFNQQIATKFAICRNLLIFKAVVLKEENVPNYESLRSVCKLDIEILLNSYYSLLWLTQQTASSILPLETQNQRLSSLKFTPIFHMKNNSQHSVSLLEMYVSSNGGADAHKDLLEHEFNEDNLAHWHTSMLPYLTRLTLLIWPVNGKPQFLEWLISSGQHLHLQRYITLLQPWCCYGTLNQSFYAGISYLNTGEIQKAYDFFSNIFKEFSPHEYVVAIRYNPAQALILFNLKIIQLLELHGARDYAIKAAEEALTRIDDEEPLKPTLYSIIFKHHLALGHYENAFQSLCTNPDSERKKDNLRDLVKTLLDAGHVNILMSFDYEDLEELFLSILYTRARAIDTVENIYYDFLYAYSVRKNMWRFSASVMYEQAYRLSFQSSLEALEKQVKCTLVSVNSLSLGDPQFAWVLKPADPDLEEEEHILPAEIGSKNEAKLVKFRNQVDIIDLAGIRKELTFVKARLQLAVLDPKSSSHLVTNAQELVMYLTTAGIFKTAFNLCKVYDMDYDTIFENLTYKCFEMNQREHTEAWNWLMENEIHDYEFIPNSPSKMVWTMLKRYLEDYEEPKMSRYHRIVTEKLLQLGDYPPFWLIASYKKRNPGELLRVYYFNGLLNAASNLAMDNISAALGYGPEHFGISQTLTPLIKPMSLNLPLNVIDSLIYELDLQNKDDKNKEDKPFEKEHELLKELFIKYIDTSTRISDDVCRQQLSAMS